MSVGAGVDVEVGAARAQIVLKNTSTQAPPLADVISSEKQEGWTVLG